MAVYQNFEEVEKSISESTPSRIYKYRDWEKPFHNTIISDHVLYFAHPHSLNDPKDCRPEYNFIIGEIDDEKLRRKMVIAAKDKWPELKGLRLMQEIESRIKKIKEDPKGYLQRNKEYFEKDKSKYDVFGVLSLCSTFDNEEMWIEYGNNFEGFAVGFDTVELARHFNCFLGIAEYSDTPLDYDLFGENHQIMEKGLLRKEKSWEYEQEVRFVTSTIKSDEDRSKKYPQNVAVEIVLGCDISMKHQDEIIAASIKTLPEIEIYKLIRDGKGFHKELIKP